ncbi:MAG: hypothetical protein PHI66_01255 [Candidatus Pacebacteria bacterium]|nr:hypothetical protein [Candidatus Paceibacterota bacterium]
MAEQEAAERIRFSQMSLEEREVEIGKKSGEEGLKGIFEFKGNREVIFLKRRLPPSRNQERH